MNLYRLGICGMVVSLFLVLVAVYILFIGSLPISFPWTMFWHFTLLLTGLSFKLSYVMILMSESVDDAVT